MEIYEFELGIIDYRIIIKTIKDVYNYDFSDHALTSLKRRIEIFCSRYGIKQTDILISRLREDANFFQSFIKEISVEATEMFRDPSLWRYLRDELFPIILSDNYKPRIWLPSCISGDELFSLLIILKEQSLLDSFDIYASCYNDLCLNQIKSGILKSNKIEVSNDNYERIQGKFKFNDYYSIVNDQAMRDTSLLKNVRFLKQNINFDHSPQDIKLILCRNQLIYFNQGMHDRVLKIFYDNMVTGGYLMLGVKEQVGQISSNFFKLVSEAESIYKKI